MIKDFTPKELRDLADYLMESEVNVGLLAIEKIRKQADLIEQHEKQKLNVYKLATTFFNEYKNSVHANDWLKDYNSFDELPEWRQRPVMDCLRLALEENGYKKVNP